MLLKGEPVSAQRALELGMIGAIAPTSALLATAQERARALAQQPPCAPWDRSQWRAPENPFDFSAADAPRAIAQHVGLSDEEFTHYPAYRAIMDCVIGGWAKPMEQACRWEMDCFVRLIRDKVAGNIFGQYVLNAELQTVKAIVTDHSVSGCRPDTAFHLRFIIDLMLQGPFH